MEYYAIDRIEENYAVCEKDGETMVNISRALLPDGAGEGNVPGNSSGTQRKRQ